MSGKKEIIGIQHLRGIAALAVVVDHTNGLMAETKYYGLHLLSSRIQLGEAGVGLFFVISGFIISYIALQSPKLEPALSPRNFLRRRFTRIVPFLWLCILAWIAFRLLGRGPAAWYLHWPGYLRALILWPVGEVDPPQVWTLPHEAAFYLLFCIALLRHSMRFVPVLLWVLFPLLRFFVALPVGDAGFLFFLSNPVHCLFGFGLTCGVLYLKCPGWFRPRLPGGFILCLGLTTAALLAMPIFSLAPFDLAAGLLFAALLYFAICTKQQWSLLDRIGETLGNASYATYLTHLIFLGAFLTFASKWHLDPLIAVALGVIGAVLFGVAVHLWIELPLLRAFRSRRKTSVVITG